MAYSFNRLDDANAARSFQSIASGGTRLVISPNNPMVGFFGTILAAYFFVINVFSIPFRLLMRKNMGERAFTVFTYVSSVICFVFVIPGLAYMGYVGWIGFGFHLPQLDSDNYIVRFLFTTLVILINPYTIFLVIFLEKGRTHFRKVLRRAKSKEYLYSFHQGEGIYFEHKKRKTFWGFQVNDAIVRMIYEPLGMLKFSVPIWIVSHLLINRSDTLTGDVFYLNFIDTFIAGLLLVSIVLSIGAVSTFLLEFGSFQEERGAALDMLDGEVDMQRLILLKESFALNQANEKEDPIRSGQKIKTSDSFGTAITD